MSREEQLREIEKIANYLSSIYPSQNRDDLFQVAYLAGLEALEEGTDVFAAMRRTVGHTVAVSDSPVEVPMSGANNAAMAKIRRGEAPSTPSEYRIASVLGKQEDISVRVPVTLDTPESLLMEKEVLDKLRDFLEYEGLYLTKQQRDAIGVRFFGRPRPEEYMNTYGVGHKSIYWHSQKALEKMRKILM